MTPPSAPQSETLFAIVNPVLFASRRPSSLLFRALNFLPFVAFTLPIFVMSVLLGPGRAYSQLGTLLSLISLTNGPILSLSLLLCVGRQMKGCSWSPTSMVLPVRPPDLNSSDSSDPYSTYLQGLGWQLATSICFSLLWTKTGPYRIPLTLCCSKSL